MKVYAKTYIAKWATVMADGRRLTDVLEADEATGKVSLVTSIPNAMREVEYTFKHVAIMFDKRAPFYRKGEDLIQK